jgi:phosphopantetheine--protein transferase-like protein
VISGIGIDLVDLKQFKRHLGQNSYFKSRLFSQAEHLLTDNQLAGNYATKEALFKASSIKIEYSKCSVLRDKNGKPFIAFNDDITTYENVNILVSITNNDKYSLAIVLLESKQEL